MATTQNTYTANGSTTNFSFTFPYLNTADVKVKINGTDQNTTSYSLANATTVQMNTAPSNGATVMIFRDTNNDSKKASFYPGSAIKAEDLNNDFDQILYTAQEIDNNAMTTLGDDPMQGDLSLGNNKLTNVGTPTAGTDGVNKTYVDTNTWDTTTETYASGETWTGNNTTIATSGAIDARIDGKIDTAIEGDVLAGTDLSKSASSGQVTINHNVTGANSTVNNSNGNVLQDITVSAQGHVTSVGSTDLDSRYYTETELNAGQLDNRYYTETQLNAGQLDNRYYTETELNAGQLDNRYYTETEVDASFYKLGSAAEIASGETWAAADNKIATTAAIDARITDLVDDVGGFVPIASETAFPTANPDVNNGAGTLVSIKEIGSTRTPSGGTVSISNGSGSNTVTITGCGSTALAAGYGVIVETTSTLHTYTFHRLTPKATEVTTIAGNITNINAVGNNTTNINTVAGNNTNINTVAGNNANVTTVAGISSNVTSVAGNSTNINAVNSNSSNINTVAGAVSNINTTAGSISNVNTVASNISSVNDFSDKYRVASSAPSSSLDEGDLWFDTTNDELKVYTGSAWQGGVTATGNLLAKSGGQMTGNLTFSGSQTVDGRDVSADGTKLDGIESNSTADMTGAEIKSAYEGESNTNAYTDAEKTKLSGIATSADQNVQSDWNASSGDAAILNKPSAYTHPNHSGEVTSTGDGATVVTDNIIDEANLKVSNSPTNGHFLSAQSGNTGGLTWASPANTQYTAGTGLQLSGTQFSVTSLAISTVQEAASQSAQLALTTQEGDTVVRTDENKSYVRNSGSAGTMADFTLLRTPTDAVLSVNGNTGAITSAQIAAAVEAASNSNTFTDADHSKLDSINLTTYAPLAGATFTGDVQFNGDNYNLLWDKSDNALEFATGAKLKVGNNTEIFEWSSGGNFQISSTGSYNLQFDANGGDNYFSQDGMFTVENAAHNSTRLKAKSNGVELYASGTKRLDVNTAGATITGTCTAGTFAGSGANLTNIDSSAIVNGGSFPAINASNLTNLTAGNLTGTLPAISGANLTSLPAGNLTGTVAIGRLGSSGTASSSTFLRGDNSWQTISGTTINNNANNRVITGSGTSNTLEGESSLTFDGTKLVTPQIELGSQLRTSGTVDIKAGSSSQYDAIRLNSNGEVDIKYQSAARIQVINDGTRIYGNVLFKGGIQEDSVTISSSGGAATIDQDTATNFEHDLTENVTYTFSNPAPSGDCSSFTLRIIQGSTARTITWPGSVDWAGGSAPTLSTGNNDVDIFVFITYNGGTTYYGFPAGQDFS